MRQFKWLDIVKSKTMQGDAHYGFIIEGGRTECGEVYRVQWLENNGVPDTLIHGNALKRVSLIELFE